MIIFFVLFTTTIIVLLAVPIILCINIPIWAAEHYELRLRSFPSGLEKLASGRIGTFHQTYRGLGQRFACFRSRRLHRKLLYGELLRRELLGRKLVCWRLIGRKLVCGRLLSRKLLCRNPLCRKLLRGRLFRRKLLYRKLFRSKLLRRLLSFRATCIGISFRKSAFGPRHCGSISNTKL